MRRGVAVAVAAAVSVICSGAAGSAAASTAASRAQVAGKLPPHIPWAPPPEAQTAPLQAALEKLKANDLAGVYAAAKAYVDRPDFESLPETTRHLAWHLLGLGAWQTDRLAEAHKAFKNSTSLTGAMGWDWLYRAYTADRDNDPHDAVYAFKTLFETDLAPLAEVEDDFVAHLRRQALDLPRGEQRQMDLMDNLLDADWKPKDPNTDWSGFWTEHAARLLDRGDVERAGKAMARVTRPEPLIWARADHRFAPLLRKDPARFDIAKAYAARLAATRAQTDAKPRALGAVNAYAMVLLSMNRAADVLAVTQAALDRRLDSWDDPKERAWTLDIQARALRDLGRADDALVAWRKSTRPENGGGVGQDLNLADALLEMDRPDETLTIVTGIKPDKVSAFGRMVAANLAVCASAATGDRAGTAKALAALVADRDAAPMLEMSGHLCADDPDGAAAILIALLKDPETRLDALAEIQDYPAPAAVAPFRRAQLARRRALYARPDVRAAIAAVGKVERQMYPAVY